MKKTDIILNSVFIILASLVAGIIISYLFPTKNPLLIASPFVVSLTLYGVTLIQKSRINSWWIKIERGAVIAFFFAGAGMLAYSLSAPQPVKIDGKVNCRVEGSVEEIANRTTGHHLLVNIDRITAPDGHTYKDPGKAYVTTGAVRLKEGDKIRFESALSELGSNQNYRRGSSDYLKKRNIYYSAFAEEKKIIKIGEESSLQSLSAATRSDIEIFIEKSNLAPATKNFIISLLLGNKQTTDRETRERFSDAGLSHILAVSGMHIGIISAIIMMLLYPLPLFVNAKWKYLIVLPLIWGYVWITGMAPSTVRAAVMISFYFLAVVLERKHNALVALGWAAIFILIFQPEALFDIGFQLSFVCVFFLLLMVGHLNFVEQRSHPRLYKLTGYFLITIIASLATWVLVSLYFGKIVTMFLPANILIVPLLPYFVMFVLAYFGLYASGIEIEALRHLIDGAFDAAHKAVGYFAGIGNVEHLQIGWPTAFLWLSGLTSCGLLIKYGSRRKRYWGTALAFLTLSLITIPYFKEKEAGDGFIVQKSFPYITIATYQGNDESILTLPKGKVSSFNHVGKNVVVIDGNVEKLAASDSSKRLLETADIVVVGGSQTGDFKKIGGLINKEATILLHSTLTRKKERNLKKILAGKRLHSIREQGPYQCL